MASATIVHDTSEAVALCPALGLYLKPITKMTISVALPPLRQPGKSISNWEVMERLKAMAAGAGPAVGAGPGGAGVGRAQFSALRIAKSTMDFIRFEGEVENRALVKPFLACLDGKTIKLSGFADALRVRAAEFRPDFPSRHDWDSFFRDADDMNEALPGERPDTIHLEGLPCRWFAPRGGSADAADATSASTSASSGILASGSASASSSACERPSEELLRQAFGAFGDIRHVDIPMLDPYRGEAAGRSFHTFSFGGHLHFEAYVQYCEYAGFARAMGALRGMKLMLKGDDGKAVACNIKVTFDSTKHLSDASIRKRQLERQKLQELELQREEQKRREKEAEERRRQEERKQREAEVQDRVRRREQKLRRREQRQRDREQRRWRRRLEKLRAEEQGRRLQGLRGQARAGVQVDTEAEVEEEDKQKQARQLLLAQRDLQSVRLVAALLGRVEAAWLRQRQDEQRRLQEAELRRVEQEKRRALGLQRRERELRQRLLSLLLSRGTAHPGSQDLGSDQGHSESGHSQATPSTDLLRPMLDILHSVATLSRPLPANPGDPLGQIPATPKDPTHIQSNAHTRTGDTEKAGRAGMGQVLACLSGTALPVTSPTATPPVSLQQDEINNEKCNHDLQPICDQQTQKRGAGNGQGGAEEEEEVGAGQQQEEEVEQEPRRRHRGGAERDRERRRSRLHRRGDHARSRSPRRTCSNWNH